MQTQNELREKIQTDAVIELMKYKRRSAAISMRVGKTLIGIKIAAEKWSEIMNNELRPPRILVVAPKLAIFDGWKEDMNKFEYEYLSSNITYSTYLSLHKLNLQYYDLIILDECHSLKISSHDYYLNIFNGDILGLTGTPPTNKYSDKYRMMSKYCPVKYTYDTEEAISAEILNDYRIIVHMIPLSLNKDIHVKKGTWDFWTSERASYNYSTKRINEAVNPNNKRWASLTRMKDLQAFKSKEVYAKKLLNQIEDKCIVFANTKDQAKELCEHSYYSGNSSSEANLALFKAGVVDKLSCVLQLSEGVTIPGLKASIILHSYGNENKFMQRFARALSLTTDEMSNIHLLAYEDSVDMDWIKTALASLDPSKIKYVKFT